MSIFTDLQKRAASFLRTGNRSYSISNSTTASKKGATVTLGGSGTASFGGFIFEDFNSDFNGQQAVRIYEQMRRTDATVNATLSALKLPILATERTIESGDAKDQRANDIAEFVRKNLFDELDGGFTNFLRQALTYLDFGFGYFEKVYEVRDGMMHLKSLAFRQQSAHQKWQTADGKPGVTQQLISTEGMENPNTTPSIPMEKLVLFVNNKEGDNYQGISVLRSAYKHFYIKDQLYRIDNIRHERGAGILTITLPEGAGDEDMSAATELGEFFKTNEKAYMIFPKPNWKVDMLTAGMSDQSGAIMESVLHHDRQITLNILAQFLNLGSGDTGSFALSKDQTSFFGLYLEAVGNYVQEVINTQLIKELVDFNYGPQENYPKLVFSSMGDVDFKEMSEVLLSLTQSGLVENNPELKVWVAKMFKLPEVSREDFEDADDAKAPTIDPEVDEDDEVTPPPVEPAALAQGKYWRELTFAEKRMKLADISNFFDDQEGELAAILSKLSTEQKAKLLKDAEKIIDSGNVGNVGNLKLLGSSELAAKVKQMAQDALENGKKGAAREVGIPVPLTNNLAKQVVATKMGIAVDQRNARIEDAVKERIVDLVNNQAGKANALFDLEKLIDEQLGKANDKLSGQVVIDSFNEGRYIAFDDPEAKDKIHGLQRSEILDDATCPMCITIDGKVLSASDPFTFVNELHDNCRGMWVAVLKTDAELPPVKILPKSITSRFNTVDGTPTGGIMRQLPKPIIAKGSRADQKIKDGDLSI